MTSPNVLEYIEQKLEICFVEMKVLRVTLYLMHIYLPKSKFVL